MDLVPGEPGTLVRERLDDVIVVRSLTKALAVPGLRVGYAVAAAPLAARLRAARPPWSANALALAALAAAARRPEALAATAARVQEEREDLDRRLRAIAGVRAWPGRRELLPRRGARRAARGGGAARPVDRRAPGRDVPRPRRRTPAHHRAHAEENARLASALEEAVAACR